MQAKRSSVRRMKGFFAEDLPVIAIRMAGDVEQRSCEPAEGTKTGKTPLTMMIAVIDERKADVHHGPYADFTRDIQSSI